MADTEKADRRARRRAKSVRRRRLKLTRKQASVLTGLTSEQIADYRTAFKHFDKNESDTICLSEFKDVLSSLKKECTDEEAAELFKSADLDGQSDLDFNEFMYAMCILPINGKDPSKIPVVQQMKRFEQIDTDGSGFISYEEFNKILSDYFPEEDVDDVSWWMIPDYDEDNDEKISVQEFLKSNVVYDL